jgi:hypothetical protein
MNVIHRRIVTGVISLCILCILAAFLEAGFFAFLHAGHDCTGETCPVCAQMKDASDALRRLLDGSLQPASLHRVFSSLFVSMFLLKSFGDARHQTPVTKKVRLND